MSGKPTPAIDRESGFAASRHNNSAIDHRMLPGRFSALLALLVIYLLCYPFLMDGNYWNPVGLVAGLVLLAALYALHDHRSWWLFGILMAVPAFLHSLRPELVNHLDVFGVVCTIIFDVFMTVFILFIIFQHEAIRRETIFGALCAYLTIGFAFANVFRLIIDYAPSSIYLDPVVNSHTVAQRADLIYYSFASLTCIGASGLIPANAYARSVTAFESVTGVVYLAVLVARLIGLHTAQRKA